VTAGSARGRSGRVTLAVIFAAPLCFAAAAAAQSVARAPASPIPVVAIGEGRSIAAALSSAIRMAVESGAGATIAGAVSSSGERLVTDSVRAVSRGVVTRYVVLDSSTVAGAARVRILAMVSRIAERDAVGARGQRIPAPGSLWTASAALDSGRRADEGQLLSGIFGAIDRQPSAYAYEVEAGPPVPSGSKLRLRLRLIRTPSPAYAALRDRALSILSAVAGPAGVRTTHFPALPAEQIEVRPCVSRCSAGERRVLNARAALDDTDSLGSFDPAVFTGAGSAPVPTFFPDLRTAGGFAVVFPDSAAQRQKFVHVRSTRGYLAVVDYFRATFDDARFRLVIGDRTIDLLQSFRAPLTGQSQPRFATTAPPGTLPVSLVQGFRPRTTGGPGAPTSLGSPYVVLALSAAAPPRADTALVDVWLTPAQVSAIAELGVEPLATTHREPAITCSTPKVAAVRKPCTRPAVADAIWRALDDDVRAVPAVAVSAPSGTAPVGAPSLPAPRSVRASAGVAPPPQPPFPLAVLDAIARPPLADGDGAVALSAGQASVVAVGTAVIDPASPTQGCAIARLRAQRELTRFITGSHLEGRIGLTTSESRGGQVQELFREDISETVAGRLTGAALAAQWTVNAPMRCRVALWLADGLTVRRDSTDRAPR
jgi:hypothetical protein